MTDFECRLNAIKTFLSQEGFIDGQDANWIISNLDCYKAMYDSCSDQMKDNAATKLPEAWPVDRSCDI